MPGVRSAEEARWDDFGEDFFGGLAGAGSGGGKRSRRDWGATKQEESFFQGESAPDWDQRYSEEAARELVERIPVADDGLLGATVSHPRFGIGEVVSVSGSGDAARLSVEFVGLGEEKTVIRKFLKVLG